MDQYQNLNIKYYENNYNKEHRNIIHGSCQLCQEI